MKIKKTLAAIISSVLLISSSLLPTSVSATEWIEMSKDPTTYEIIYSKKANAAIDGMIRYRCDFKISQNVMDNGIRRIFRAYDDHNRAVITAYYLAYGC